jgi:hypothetical protein
MSKLFACLISKFIISFFVVRFQQSTVSLSLLHCAVHLAANVPAAWRSGGNIGTIFLPRTSARLTPNRAL